LVIIDESGDPGFRIARGSTSHFVVSMVIFGDYQEAERASAEIGKLREHWRVKPEFKFSKSSDAVRDAFFATACGFRFTVRAMVVNKAHVYSDHLRAHSDRFYAYFLRMLMSHDNGVLHGARIKIDGSGDREFRNALAAYLRQRTTQGQIASFKFADSASDNLVQLADMTAGAILRSYRAADRKRACRWREMLTRAGRLRDVWNFR
jgi:Protein of unknown function (DUF3800)